MQSWRPTPTRYNLHIIFVATQRPRKFTNTLIFQVPKVLAQESPAAKYALDGTAEVLQMVEMARSLKHCQVCWMAKYNEKAKRIEPNGVALLSLKLLIVPGGGELKLE